MDLDQSYSPSLSQSHLQDRSIPKRTSSIHYTSYVKPPACYEILGWRGQHSTSTDSRIESESDTTAIPEGFTVNSQERLMATDSVLGALSTESLPFPLTPKTVSPSSSSSPSTPRIKRSYGTPREPYPTPPSSPDRYVPLRKSTETLGKVFKVSKRPSQLSFAEQILRNSSVSQSPFGPRRSSRPSPVRFDSYGRTGSSPRSSLSAGNTNVDVMWRPLTPTTSHVAPVRAVPDGRGRLLGSGTNARIYFAKFFPAETVGEINRKFERRLALALNIDQSSRVLGVVQPKHERARTGIELRAKANETEWINGQLATSTEYGTISPTRSLVVRHIC